MKRRKGKYNLARSRQVAVIREKTPREIRKDEFPPRVSPKQENDRLLASVLTSQFDEESSED